MGLHSLEIAPGLAQTVKATNRTMTLHHELWFKVFDTAGLDEARRDTLEARMSAQAETAIGDAVVGNVRILREYDRVIRSQHLEMRVPAVVRRTAGPS
jgi:predicted GTPase